MRLAWRTRLALLLLLVPVLGYAAYRGGLHFWVAHHRRAAVEALEQRDFRAAATHLKTCLGFAPDNLDLQLLAAQTARRQGNYDEARRHLRVVQELQPSSAVATREHELLAIQQGDLMGLIPLLTNCHDHAESPETPLILEACITATLEALTPLAARMSFQPDDALLVQMQGAEDLWLQLCPGRADQVEGLVWRGRTFAFLGDLANAAADLRRALTLDSDHFEARRNLALALTRDAPAEAADLLETLRRRDPENDQVRLPLARARRAVGQQEEARQLLDEMLTAHPDNVGALLERGGLALDTEHAEDAERLLRRAVSAAPNDPGANLALGKCLQRAGKETEAQRYLATSRRLSESERQRREALQQKAKLAG
jgi:predicted Zn-dependent protease